MTKEDLPDRSTEVDSGILSYETSSSICERPVVHPVTAAPMPVDSEFTFFDPYDPSCQEILFDTKTTTSELFAILRQWVPQVQQNIDIIGKEILRRGCNVNDRDGLTDMTLLHYTCKAGAQGIGDAETAAKFASHLISLGADVTLRSRWTNMNALHYAAYFDVPELITVILKSSKPKDVDATCSDFDFGTALHIAASNLCVGAVKCLLDHGANPAFKNEKGQIPADVIPNPVDMPLEMADAAAIAKELKQMLLDAVTLSCDISRAMPLNLDHVSGQAFLKSLGIKLGDRVSIAGQKIGSLRFCGPTQFAGGQWAGIELDDPDGKNDGSVGGVQYFKCPLKHGIFAPLSKISKAADHKKSTLKTLHQLKSRYKLQKTDLPRETSKLDTGSVKSKPLTCTESKVISSSKEVAKSQGGGRGLWSRAISMGSVNSDETDIKLGDRVLVVGQRTGVVRFCGKTSFAPGCWYGIELDKPHGKNDGSVGDVRYFTCAAKHGVFAPPSRVQRITDSMDSLSDIPASKLNHSFPGFRRSLSSSSTVSSQNDQNRLKSFSLKKPEFRRSWSSTSGGSSEGSVKLRKGSQVLLVSSNEMATVRYIGPTDFASGIWLGLELKSPKGKNDGSVGEKRYFTCKQNYGVLVRPTRVTYRGINGGKLVDDIS